MDISWSPHAMRELKQIYEYYKTSQSLKFAQKFRKKVYKRVAPLKSFPHLGKKLKSPKGKHFRFLIEGHYKIVYSIRDDEILIEMIIDSRRGG